MVGSEKLTQCAAAELLKLTDCVEKLGGGHFDRNRLITQRNKLLSKIELCR
ncbi:hypothetical protein OCOJLMKI_4922 [Methylobacterium iners]|uniref:Transposase n=1 Tax=Methylobacterium iners TaxID=418707 RepID=A0ABQ4S3L5_9HYPH|nr:hypothetical protein OCOJLMKI_4922 [Methylobacterium iners]